MTEQKAKADFQAQQIDVWQHILDKGQDPIESKMLFILAKRNEWAGHMLNHDQIKEPSNLTPLAYPLVMEWVDKNLKRYQCEPIPELTKLKTVKEKVFYILLLMEVKLIEGYQKTPNAKADFIRATYFDASKRLIAEAVNNFKEFDIIRNTPKTLGSFRAKNITRELLVHYKHLASYSSRSKLVTLLEEIL